MKRILAAFLTIALLWGNAALSENEAAQTVTPGDVFGAIGSLAEEVMPTVVAQVGDDVYYTVERADSSDAQASPPELWVSAFGMSKKLADIAHGAAFVPKDRAIYFLDRQNSRFLMALDVPTGAISQAMNLGFDNARLTASMNGLMVSGLIEVGVYANRLYDAATGALTPSDVNPTGEYHNYGAFETLQTASGGLALRTLGSADWKNVYSGLAAAQTALDGEFYYLLPEAYLESDYLEIYRVDPETGAGAYATQVEGRFSGQMLSAAGFLVLVGPQGVMAVDPETGEQRSLYQPEAPLIDPGVLKVSDALFLYARADTQAPETYVVTLSLSGEAPQPTPEPTPEPTAEPARDLSKGSRGDDVLALQMRLNDLGYPAGKEDGIYGVSTDGAVRYFQDALGMSQTGKATAALQAELYAPDAPGYVAFVPLSQGSRGIRVEALQTRLRALNYTAAKVDGAYGDRTADAVKLFQKEAGLRQTGEASASVLEALMDSGAPECSGYVTLRKGDSGAMVTSLQERLKALGYYAGDNSGSYDSRTAAAVEMFQETQGISADGVAGARTQQRLFASGAPKCDEYIELRYGDSGPRVKSLQSRLKKLSYFDGNTGGNFGSQTQSAVKAYQRDMGLKQTGVATVSLQQALFEEDWPTPIPRPTRTPRPTPRPTRTARPTPTPKPTATPRPSQVISNSALDEFVDLLNGATNHKMKYTRKTAVLWLQNELLDMFYFDPAEGDGNAIYDRPTFNAVKKFQKDMGISLSAQNYGYVRQKTLDALIEYGGSWRNPGDPISRA